MTVQYATGSAIHYFTTMMSTRLTILITFLAATQPVSKIFAQDKPDTILVSAFKNPPVSARPKALWPWVNGNFSLAAITYEMEEAKRMGMGGFDIWDVGTSVNPRNIVPAGPPFLGDESLDGIAYAIREGNRLGLELGLITSSSWNAGGAWVKPEHGAMGLFRSDTIITGPAEVALPLSFPDVPSEYNGRKTLVQRSPDGTPVFYREVATLWHPMTKDSTISGGQVRTITTGNKTVRLPAGNHRLVRYVCAPTGQPLMIPSGNSNGLMLDHFSAEAQEANMRYILQRLKTRFPSLKNQSLKYLYEDSYEVNTAVWTPALGDAFNAHAGYKVEEFLPVLDGFTLRDKAYSSRFLFDFNKVLSEMIIANHYAKGRSLSAAEGLGFHAEAGGPGKPIHNVPFEDLKALGSLTVPRGEFWNKHPQLELLQIVKGIASAAHIYDQRFVEAEAFTSVWLWQEGPDKLKSLADRAMVEGLNRFVYHTFPHTTPEAGTPGWIYNFGTLINTTNGWWPKSAGFHQYLARCSYLLQQGLFVGDVAFYYGDEAPNFVKPKHVPATLGKGYDYDVVNTEVILNRMSVRDGKIMLPHGQTYEVLVLPEDDRINPAVLEKIEAMVRDGATVIGRRPKRPYSLSNYDASIKKVDEIAGRMWKQGGRERTYGKGRVVWGKTVREVLADRKVIPDVSIRSTITHDSVDFIHRVADGRDIYFIRNISRNRFTGLVAFRVSASGAAWWNPVDGSTRAIAVMRGENNTEVPLMLEGEETAFIVFGDPGSSSPGIGPNQFNAATGTVTLTKNHSTTALDGPWEVRLEHRSGEPQRITLHKLQSLHTSKIDKVRSFSGLATYSIRFTPPAATGGQRIMLRLNNVREIADVYINGNKIGTHWHHSQRFDLTPWLRDGENAITVETVNSINNALVGDARKPEEYRTFRSNISKLPNAWMTPFAEAPFIPAGLLGPVEIYIEE